MPKRLYRQRAGSRMQNMVGGKRLRGLSAGQHIFLQRGYRSCVAHLFFVSTGFRCRVWEGAGFV